MAKSKEEKAEYQKEWKIKNPDYTKNYYEENKEKIRNTANLWYKDNKEKGKGNSARWIKENPKKTKSYKISLKLSALKMINEKVECAICGEKNLKYLTVDHIKNDGAKYRKLRGNENFYSKLIKNKISEEELNFLQILCWNCNCSKSREYLDIPFENQTYHQKRQTELWRKAYKFFGRCKCGQKELKYLSISHIHNDGAEKRRTGEKNASALLLQFKKQGWSKSLKKDYRLECFNCNCSKKIRKKILNQQIIYKPISSFLKSLYRN